MEVVYHTSKLSPFLSFLTHSYSTPSLPSQSWSDAWLFHFFEVGMRSALLDRLSELPAGLSYSRRRKTLHLSRYSAHTGPISPLPFTLCARDDLSLWSIHMSVNLCGYSSASGHENHGGASSHSDAGEAWSAIHWLQSTSTEKWEQPNSAWK